jgi:hypothetical protein
LCEGRREHFGLGRRALIIVVAGDRPERAEGKQREQQREPRRPVREQPSYDRHVLLRHRPPSISRAEKLALSMQSGSYGAAGR